MRATRPATAKTAAGEGSRVVGGGGGAGGEARSRPGTAYSGAASRPQTAKTAASTQKSLRSGSGESGLGGSASDGELDAAGGGGGGGGRRERDGAYKLAQMQERTRHKAAVRHQVHYYTVQSNLFNTAPLQISYTVCTVPLV